MGCPDRPPKEDGGVARRHLHCHRRRGRRRFTGQRDRGSATRTLRRRPDSTRPPPSVWRWAWLVISRRHGVSGAKNSAPPEAPSTTQLRGLRRRRRSLGPATRRAIRSLNGDHASRSRLPVRGASTVALACGVSPWRLAVTTGRRARRVISLTAAERTCRREKG